jgi:hypothetical protein
MKNWRGGGRRENMGSDAAPQAEHGASAGAATATATAMVRRRRP